MNSMLDNPSKVDTTVATQSPSSTSIHVPTESVLNIASTAITTDNTLALPTNDSMVTLPRDGGARAWLVVLGSFLIHSFAFAPTEYIFGIFELHYQIIYHDAAPSSVAFVGTTGSAATYLAGFLAGIVADRFGFKATAFTGTVVMTLSLVLASFAKQLWQLYITQGILFGIGASLAYYPAIAVPSHHFNKRRGLATGLAVSGVGAGGLVLAPLTQSLIDSVGIYWTLRIIALLCFVVCGIASTLIVEGKNHVDISQPQNEKSVDNEKCEDDKLGDVEKVPEDKPSFFAALKVFKDPRFLSLSLAELIASIAFLIPLYYMQTYAVFVGISVERGALILGLSNGASFAGRITLGVISDYVSNAKVLLFCSWCTAFAVLVLWTISHSFGPLLLMGLMFGFFGGGYISLVPVAVAQSFGTKEIASTIGLMYAGGGLGMLGGAPLAGFLLDITQPNTSYLPVTLTSGIAMTLGALCISTWAYLDRKTKRARLATNK